MAAQMKTVTAQALCPAILAVAGLAAASALTASPAQAAASGFSCGTSNGVPTTIALTDDGRSVPMIRWTSNVFDGSGWTPARRCQEVSQRFESYRQQGRLAYVTTGRINGLPVICTAARDGGACDGLLYTLKPGQDPTTALKLLFDVRYKARGPLNETSSRLYISMDQLLAAKGGASSSPSSTSSSAEPTKPLW